MTQSHQSKISTSRRRLIKAALASIVAPAVLRIGPAFAAYPDRPVRIVVANTPGGPSDIIARIMAAAMQEAMPGSSIIVENKGGGGGNIGMGYVARSDADGYTILLSTSAYSVNPGLYNNPPYDPFKDFSAVCELAVSPHVFAVMPDLGVKSMKEFVALAKTNPDKFNVSTPPIGTTPQLQAEVLKLREGLQKMATIVFPGGGDALKALAVTGPTRWHDLPDIPTMVESGYPDFVFDTYTALMAPAKTPPEIVSRLEKVALEILSKPDMRQRLTQAGFEVTARTGQGHMERVAKEVPMFRDIMVQAGIAKL
jgi:tripartite-type tricarboxylate transporter receptor subunit TctC